MRRVSVILAALAIASVIQVEGVRACRFLHRSTGHCGVSYCRQPTVHLSTVCEPASEVAVEAMEPTLAEPTEDIPAVSAPEVPPAPPVEEPTLAEQAPPEPPAAVVEETVPADEEAPASDEDAMKAFFGEDAEEPASTEEAPASDEDALKAFFGEDAEEPAPVEEPEPEAPATESPADGEEKSALDAFFQTQTPLPANSPVGNAGFRIWRDVTGRYELEAKFVTCFDDGTVRLAKPNGRWVRLPHSQLSRADQLLASQMFAASKMIAVISK